MKKSSQNDIFNEFNEGGAQSPQTQSVSESVRESYALSE